MRIDMCYSNFKFNCFRYNKNNVYVHVLPGFDPRTENHLLILPFYHIFGIGIVVSALMEGFTVIAMQQFQLNLYCECIQDYKVCVF